MVRDRRSPSSAYPKFTVVLCIQGRNLKGTPITATNQPELLMKISYVADSSDKGRTQHLYVSRLPTGIYDKESF